MTSPSLSFFSLPGEVRELFYDYAFEEVVSNLNDPGTAYTRESAPLLYVHQTITKELQPRLYPNHTTVLSIQEPSTLLRDFITIVPPLGKLSLMRKRRTKTLIVEVSQTQTLFHESGDYEDDVEEDADKQASEVDCNDDEDDWEMEDHEFWEEHRGGGRFATKLTGELLKLKQQMPSITKIKLVFWCSVMKVFIFHWDDHLDILRDFWDDLDIEVQINAFDYVDPEPGNEGVDGNWIQAWEEVCRPSASWLHFSAFDLKLENHLAGHYVGREFEPKAWEVFNIYEIRRGDELLHTGWEVECRPYRVTVGETAADM